MVLSLPVFLGRDGGKDHRPAAGPQGWAEGREAADVCHCIGGFGGFMVFFPPCVFMSAYRLHTMCIRGRLRFLCLSISGDDMKNKG